MLKNLRHLNRLKTNPSRLAKDETLKQSLTLMRRLAFAIKDSDAELTQQVTLEILQFYVTVGNKYDLFYDKRPHGRAKLVNGAVAPDIVDNAIEQTEVAKEVL